MKKMIKALIALIIFIVLTLVFLLGGKQVLNNAGLSFRPWVDSAGIVVVGISTLAVFVLVIVILIRILKKQLETVKAKVILKGISAAGIVLCIALGFYAARATLLGFFFGYCEEYVVERDNRKMIAVVQSFLGVNVYYYPYKNWLTMGNNKLIHERYGKGGYDPLDGKHTVKPKETTYYYDRDSTAGD